jgi:hypothetical protein
MAKDRWNQGKPSLGDAFDPGFISPWDAGTRKGHGDYEDIATIPMNVPPDTMAGQMDGDQNVTAAAGRGSRKKK